MWPIVLFICINFAVICLGYRCLKGHMLPLSWLMFITSTAIVYCIFDHANAVIKMFAIIATVFTGMKVVTATQTYQKQQSTLTFIQWLAFTLGWAGMQVRLFETLGNAPLPNAWPMIRFGFGRMLAGLSLLFTAHVIAKLPLNSNLHYIVVSVLLLTGCSLVLHFGILSISAGFWRLWGVNCNLLFKQPLKSVTLTEFWSKRWNLAFTEMTSISVFRPLKNKIGAVPALILAFAFSGILHELALSAPVSSGYGLPLLYFVLQGILVLAEKKLLTNGLPSFRNRVLAKLWVLFWVIVPAPLLFHKHFITLVLWPLSGLDY